MNKTTRVQLLFILAFCSLYAPIISTGYIPLLPALAKAYKATYPHTQLLITVFLFGFVSAQVFAGTFANFFGRRKIILTGIIISTVGSFLCVLASSLGFLFIAFYFQAFGVGFIIPTQNVMVSESGSDEEKTRIGYIIINSALCVGSIIAPFICSFMAAKISLEFSFAASLTLGIVIFILALKFLPETETHAVISSEPLFKQMKSILPKFVNCFKGKPIFSLILLYSACLSAVGAAFSAGVPGILINNYHLSVERIGLCFMAVNIFSTVGVIAAFGLSKLKRSSLVLFYGGVMCIIACIALPILRHYIHQVSFTLIIPYLVIVFVVGILTPSVWYTALNNGEIHPADAAALMIFWQNVFSIIAVFLVDFSEKASLPLASVFMVFFIIALGSSIHYLRMIAKGIAVEV